MQVLKFPSDKSLVLNARRALTSIYCYRFQACVSTYKMEKRNETSLRWVAKLLLVLSCVVSPT